VRDPECTAEGEHIDADVDGQSHHLGWLLTREEKTQDHFVEEVGHQWVRREQQEEDGESKDEGRHVVVSIHIEAVLVDLAGSVRALNSFEVVTELLAHEANVAQSATHSVGNKDHEVADKYVSCFLLRVGRVLNN